MFRNFVNNIYPKILSKILSVFDIPSGPIVGLWSLIILIGCAYSIWSTKTVSGPISMIFSTIISAFAGHKIVKVWKSNDQDSTGDDNGNNSATPQG